MELLHFLRILLISNEVFFDFLFFFMIWGLTLYGGEGKRQRDFNSELDSYETANPYEAEIVLISGGRLPLRGGTTPRRSCI